MKDLTVGNEGKLIFQFAWPMVLGNIFQQLYNVADSVIIGNYVGNEALAAVGASFPIIFLLVAMIIGVTSGFTIIISQYFGSKNIEKVRRTVDTTYIILFFAAIFITVFGIFFSGAIFRLTDLPEEIIPQAKLYLNIYFTGTIFFVGFNATSAILRGMGDSRTPLYFLILANVANIILALLFVVVFKWGIAGAAFATVIAQAGAFITAILYLNKRHQIVNISIRKYLYDHDIMIKSFKIGLPSGLQQTFVALGLIALYGIVNKFGTATIAAYGVAARIDSFASLLAMNFSAALSAFVGQNLGANKPERIKAGFQATWVMTSVISVFFSVVVIFFGKALMRLFTPDPAVIEIGNDYLVIVGSFYIIFSTLFVLTGVMRGAGDTVVPMFITLIALWAIRIPASYYLAGKIGVTGIWWAVPVGWSVGMTLSWFYYKTDKWKTKGVVKYEIKG